MRTKHGAVISYSKKDVVGANVSDGAMNCVDTHTFCGCTALSDGLVLRNLPLGNAVPGVGLASGIATGA